MHTIRSPYYVTSAGLEIMETQSRVVAAMAWGGGEWEIDADPRMQIELV